MSIEDFRNQLISALTGKRKADQEKTLADSLLLQQEETRVKEERQRARTQAFLWLQEKNQRTTELDANLPIGDYLGALRDLIAPKEKISKLGPDNGIIAYSFVYSRHKEKIIFGTYSTPDHLTQTKGGLVGSHGTRGFTSKTEPVRDTLGVIFSDLGNLIFRRQQCANSPSYNQSEDPRAWEEEDRKSSAAEENARKMYIHSTRFTPFATSDDSKIGMATFSMGRWKSGMIERKELSITSPNDFQQFAQMLKDFYVGLKTGGK